MQIGRRHPAKIVQQAIEAGIANIEAFDIGDRQGEARADKQVAGGPHVDPRMHARRRPIRFCSKQQRTQPRQAVAADERAEEQAVRPKRAPGERQSAGQVVDAIEHARRNDQIERFVGKREAILIRLHAANGSREAKAGIGTHDADAGGR